MALWAKGGMFQSTLLREERPTKSKHLTIDELFQSTLLREERLPAAANETLPSAFQSTLLREERHDESFAAKVEELVSIHAPA